MSLTGDKVVAMASGSDTQNANGTTASTTYTASIGAGTPAGKVFVAPPSGQVVILNACNMFNSGANHGFCTVQVRLGGSIGSGTIVYTGVDADAVVANGTGADRHGAGVLVSGLTPGTTYNVQEIFRVDGGTGTFGNKHLIVIPQP